MKIPEEVTPPQLRTLRKCVGPARPITLNEYSTDYSPSGDRTLHRRDAWFSSVHPGEQWKELPPRSTALLEKLTTLIKFPTLYGTPRFITILTTAVLSTSQDKRVRFFLVTNNDY